MKKDAGAPPLAARRAPGIDTSPKIASSLARTPHNGCNLEYYIGVFFKSGL
jgi:hypothetical protein